MIGFKFERQPGPFAGLNNKLLYYFAAPRGGGRRQVRFIQSLFLADGADAIAVYAVEWLPCECVGLSPTV